MNSLNFSEPFKRNRAGALYWKTDFGGDQHDVIGKKVGEFIALVRQLAKMFHIFIEYITQVPFLLISKPLYSGKTETEMLG